MVAVVLGLSLVSFIVVRNNVISVLERRLAAHAESVARAVASHHVDASALAPDASHDLIRAMVETDPEVLYAVVQSADGRAAVIARRPSAPAERLAEVELSPSSAVTVNSLRLAGGRVIESVAPVGDTELFARVGLTASLVEAEIAATTGRLALVGAAGLVLGTGLALALTRWFTRPILALQRAVRDAPLGAAWGGPGTQDEIEEVTRAFTAMTVGLARSRDALMVQNRELAVLNAAGQAIGGSLELDEILRAALDAILREMNLQAGWVLLDAAGRAPSSPSRDDPEAGGGVPAPLVFAFASGLSPAFAVEEATRDWQGCLCLEVLTSRECLVVDDIQRDCPRLNPETVRREGLVSHASAPLVARDRVIGVLNVASDSSRSFSPDELRLLALIGRQIGVAVDNSRLWDQVQRREHLRGQLLERTLMAQEEERRRIALELHDQLGSALASLGVGLRVLEDRQQPARQDRDQFRSLREQVAEIARDLHRLAIDLRPPALDRLGLAEAVEQTVNDFARRHGMEADFQALGLDEGRLPSEVETTLYRIIQEALTNVAKHARASEVGVLLERRADTIVAIVEDNGCGFDPGLALASDSGQLGLFGMQERAGLVGGRWTVESAPGMGATIFLEIPLESAPIVAATV